METPLADFVSAGFLITVEVPRPSSSSFFSAELLPDHIISASGCIAHFIPDTWCIEWAQDTMESRLAKARVFALDHLALAKVTEWVTQRFDDSIYWPNVIMNLDTAKQLFHLFLSTLPNVKVIELALHERMSEVLCREAEPPPQQPGYAPIGRQGVHEAVLRANLPNLDGNILGFEPLVFDHSLSCSWLCNGLETVVAKGLGIKPNQHGLIQTFDDACKCVEYISQDNVGAEPGLWLPWLMIDHTKSIQ